ncbi:hypothetical protein KGM48_02470 [Patescibacteria group bacterium]|nr:hypothetical protein [Patescibacteria group bacterium]
MTPSHAYGIEAEALEGIALAEEWVRRELEMEARGNPDIVVLRYGLLSVADARRVAEYAVGAPMRGANKVVIVAAIRAYHETQNALLKLFEEPPLNTYLFFIMPSFGNLLPTLRSRIQMLESAPPTDAGSIASGIASEFLKASKEKRSALIKKLASGKDDDDRRENREEAIALLNGVEAALLRQGLERHAAALSDILTLRGYLYDRSAPVRMILEHLSLVIPSPLR